MGNIRLFTKKKLQKGRGVIIVGLMRINVAACTIACSQAEIGSLHLIISGIEVNFICLINDYTSPLYV
jgi:hypothetical protein